MSNLSPSLTSLAHSQQPAENRVAESGGLFALLEERVSGLLERFHTAQKRIEDLESELAQRDARVGFLERASEELRARGELDLQKRTSVRERVSALIAQVEAIEQRESERIGDGES